MLHWLQNALPKKNILLLQFFCLSFFLHLFLVLSLMLIGYFSTRKTISFTVHAKNLSDQAIYFMPLARSVNSGKSASLQKSTPLKLAPKKSAVISKSQPQKKQLIKKIVQPRPLVKKTPTVQKKDIEKIVLQDLSKKISSDLSRNLNKIKDNLNNKSSKKEEVVKKEILNDSQIKVAQNLISDLSKKELESKEFKFEGLVLGREELASFKMYQVIQSEISQHWTPPVGLSLDLECSIRASVSNSGSIDKVVVEKSSGVLTYDMSARMAFVNAQMPKEVYGKEIILNFKQ